MHMEGLGPTVGRSEGKCCQEGDAPALWISSLICRQTLLAALAEQSEEGGLLSTPEHHLSSYRQFPALQSWSGVTSSEEV